MVAPSGIEPPTQGFSVPCSTDWATEPINKWRSRRELNSRSSAWQADVITATPRDQNMVAEARFELTTFGLWAQRATRLLHSAILNIIYLINKWRRKRDSNPRAVSDLPVFKTGPFNQTWVFLHKTFVSLDNELIIS